MNGPYCKRCGKYLGQFEFEYYEDVCEACLTLEIHDLTGRLMQSDEYYEAVANDLDSFLIALENNGRTECSADSVAMIDGAVFLLNEVQIIGMDCLWAVQQATTPESALELTKSIVTSFYAGHGWDLAGVMVEEGCAL